MTRRRLLLAVASAYIKAHGLDRADPPADPEHYARWLLRHADPGALDGVTAEVAAADLLDAAKAMELAERQRERLAAERAAVDTWVIGWRKARDAFRSAAGWRDGAHAAIRSLGFKRYRRGELDDIAGAQLAQRYRTLARQIGKVAAIEQIADERGKEVSAIRKSLFRIGIKGLPRL